MFVKDQPALAMCRGMLHLDPHYPPATYEAMTRHNVTALVAGMRRNWRKLLSPSLLGARHSSGAQAHDAPLEWRAPSKDSI